MTGTSSILVVEDRDSLRRLFERTLSSEGYSVVTAADLEEAQQLLRSSSIQLVITDLKLPDGSGIDVLRASREVAAELPVVVMTAYGSVADAVEAMKLGAIDFLEKPVELDELSQLVASLIRSDDPGALFRVDGAPPIIGRHPRMRAALRLLQKVAVTESTVLLTGESGTGKELFARALHGLSPRASGPFVAVNCAAIPEALLENELFGHEKGAYTGASSRQAGRFEQAGGGTLLMDEIGELPLAVQAKVLRVLEERTYERVGSSSTHRANVRLVAATNRELGSMVQEGGFRADLFYRLEIFPIELPPLRERASDVARLAVHLLAGLAEKSGREAPTLTPSAAELLADQEWPGNVRQLSNVLERALILTDASRLDRADLQPLLEPLSASATASAEPSDSREAVKRALVEAGGDKRRAAEILGVSYRTLSRRIQEHDLEGFPRYRTD